MSRRFLKQENRLLRSYERLKGNGSGLKKAPGHTVTLSLAGSGATSPTAPQRWPKIRLHLGELKEFQTKTVGIDPVLHLKAHNAGSVAYFLQILFYTEIALSQGLQPIPSKRDIWCVVNPADPEGQFRKYSGITLSND